MNSAKHRCNQCWGIENERFNMAYYYCGKMFHSCRQHSWCHRYADKPHLYTSQSQKERRKALNCHKIEKWTPHIEVITALIPCESCCNDQENWRFSERQPISLTLCAHVITVTVIAVSASHQLHTSAAAVKPVGVCHWFLSPHRNTMTASMTTVSSNLQSYMLFE